MIKTVGVVSLSAGTLGEGFARHALPRCILTFGMNALVDAQAQTITFDRP